jgi:hypothetical protein
MHEGLWRSGGGEAAFRFARRQKALIAEAFCNGRVHEISSYLC